MGYGLLIIIGGLSLAALIMFVAYAYERFRSETAHHNIIGQEARIINWSGDRGNVYIRNRQWPAYSTDPVALPAGSKVLVSRIDNGALKIQPIEEDLENTPAL